MRRPTSLALLATTALLAAGLSGCGDDPGSGGGGGGDEAQVWKPSSDVPAEPGSDGLTPPGAVLEPGATARLEIADSILSDANLFPAQVRVDEGGIAEGDRDAVAADLEDDIMGDPDDLEDKVWYLRVTITAGPEAAGLTGTVTAVDAEGDSMAYLGRGGFEDCAMTPVPAGGGSFETCTVVTGDERPVAVAWDTGTEEYDDDPVLWYFG